VVKLTVQRILFVNTVTHGGLSESQMRWCKSIRRAQRHGIEQARSACRVAKRFARWH